MVKFIDYYKVLQVDASAEPKIIEAAFRKLSSIYHPDINKDPSAEEKYKMITEAYFVLKDKEKRKKYDEIYKRFKTKATKPSKSSKKIVIPLVIVFSIIIIIFFSIFYFNYLNNKDYQVEQQDNNSSIAEQTNQSKQNEEEKIIIPSQFQLNQDLNIVIAGSGEDLLEPEVNSIIFTSYYNNRNETRSICLPVQTLMDIPGIGAELINRSVEIGGMDLLALTLEKGLGIDMQVDYYILMDISGVVDRLGGIKINLDQAYIINDYASGKTFSLEPGSNLLYGTEALNILKYFSGIERNVPLEDIIIQKKIIDSIIVKIVGEDDESFVNNLNLIKDMIDSDLNLEELLKLFSTFSKIGADKNIIYALEASSTELEGEGIVYLPDITNIAQKFSENNY